MSSTKSQIRALGAVAALAALALAMSCRGFFVKPILSSLTVAPNAPSIQTGSTNNTVQMSAIGQFNDGSTGNPAVSWSISPNDGSIATISSSGLVTSVAVGSATVTATATQNPSVSGTQQVTVTVGCITSITLNPTSA
ncbi:MAG TPA: Ig-like domain-containing protein, partial [Candidatus Binatia bacterium]|nr:Ig-like domain-containing protein [Candidatus Binatia bacterium]